MTIPTNSISRASILQYVMRQLGYPVVSVELTEDQIRECINTAINEYMANGAMERGYHLMDVVSGKNDYELPKEIGSVTQVLYSLPNETIAGSTQDLFTYAVYNSPVGINMANSLHGPSNIGVFFEYIQNRNRVIGADITFKIIDNTIYLYPPPKMSGQAIIEYAKNPYSSDSDDEKDALISASNAWGITWIKRYTLAESKNILGLIRGKYSNVSGGPGESQTLNAAELLSQSKEEITALRDELASKNNFTQFYFA
jgi:hypothetical protein